MTKQLLKIYECDGSYSKTIWYKLLKILAHLTSLQDIPFEYNEINEIFKFSLTAYQKTGEENLSFLYLMKVVMLLTKARGDCDIIFENVSNYKLILTKLSVYFEKNHKPS